MRRTGPCPRRGLQSVTVRATDNDGAVSEASVSVTVYGETPVPVDGLRLWLDAGEEVDRERRRGGERHGETEACSGTT